VLPSRGGVTGGGLISIVGSAFASGEEPAAGALSPGTVQCRFGEEAVEGERVSWSVVSCVAPAVVGVGVVALEVPSPQIPFSRNTLHPTPYTLHPTPYTPHPTPHTLHPTPYSLHPAP